MSLPFKIKKMAISEVDSSFIIDEIVSSIAKIKKQKQRPNTERIFSMMVKSHPELTLSCLNEAIERAIQEGLVVNYLHNGVYSYRVVPTTSESINKFVSDRSVEEAVKWLFYDGKLKEFTLDDLECSVKQHFSPGSMFSSCLRDVIVNACGELVQLGELTYARGVYTKNMSVHKDADIKQFTCTNNNDNDVKSKLATARDSTLLKKNEPPDIKDNSPIKKFVKVKQANLDSPSNREDLKLSDDTHISSKESFSNLQSPSSDASSDKPKKKKARSLQVSFLFDSLSNFFSVSGEKRRASRSAAEKSLNSNVSQGSKSSRQLKVEANKSHISTKKASKTTASKTTSNFSDWQFDQQPPKKKSKAPPKITPSHKKSSLQTSNDHSAKFVKAPSVLHSALGLCSYHWLRGWADESRTNDGFPRPFPMPLFYICRRIGLQRSQPGIHQLGRPRIFFQSHETGWKYEDNLFDSRFIFDCPKHLRAGMIADDSCKPIGRHRLRSLPADDNQLGNAPEIRP